MIKCLGKIIAIHETNNLQYVMTGRYDLIFGMGEACSCSQALRAAGLQFASFPWDWIAFPSMPERAKIMCDGFKGWLEMADLEYVATTGGGKVQYRNVKNGIIFNHDFTADVPLSESFPVVKARYDRRIARLDRLIRAAQRPVLVLSLDTPAKGGVTTPLEDCREARRILSAGYPGISFEMCLVSLDRSRPYADRIEEEVEPGLLHAVFDYADHTPGAPDFSVDFNMLTSFLAAHFSVRDYRTPEEKRAFKELRRRQKYAKAGVSGFWGLLLHRVRKHLHMT